MFYVVATLALSFLIGSSSFLQVISTNIKSWLSSKFGQILQRTMELAAIEHLNQRTNDPLNAHLTIYWPGITTTMKKVAIALLKHAHAIQRDFSGL